MSYVSTETTTGSHKRKLGSNFNSGNDNKLIDYLSKSNYFLYT